MQTITFKIMGEIKGKMRPRAVAFGRHARVYTPQAQINSETWIREEYLHQAEKEQFNGFKGKPMRVEIINFKKIPTSFSKKKRLEAIKGNLVPCTKPDLDNLAKTILDALNGFAYEDDKNIVYLSVEKHFAEEDYTYVTISEWNTEKIPFEEIGTEKEPILENIKDDR